MKKYEFYFSKAVFIVLAAICFALGVFNESIPEGVVFLLLAIALTFVDSFTLTVTVNRNENN